MADNRYVVFDYETGGLSPAKHAATEIALCVLDPDLEIIEEYESGIIGKYGDLEYTPKALEINGIAMSDIENGRGVADVVKEVEAILKKHKQGRFDKPIMVAHNYPFDLGFLRAMFKSVGKDADSVIDEAGMCTIRMSKMAWAGEDMKFNLRSCCDKAGVELVDAHRAMNDVRATVDLFRYHVRSLRNSNGGGGAIVNIVSSVKRTFKF